MSISDFCAEESNLIIYILGIPELYFSRSLWRVMQFLMRFYHLQIPLGSSLTQNDPICCCSIKKAAIAPPHTLLLPWKVYEGQGSARAELKG